MEIRPATKDDVQILTEIIRAAYRTVADRFGLTAENCPKHPSNCTDAWIRADFDRGVSYFLMETPDGTVGCVALEKAGPEVCYLERLAVFPEHRNHGCGKAMVDFIFDRARDLGCEKVGIGIIAAQDELRQWYGKIGFREGDTKVFDHLPFDVMFMEYSL